MTSLDDVVKLYWNHWESKFSLITKNPNSAMIPITVGHQSNIVSTGDEFGNVMIYTNPESLRNNIGSNF